MMHEHDLDLIAAIAEGDMSPVDQAAAEASLCEECRTDLQLQREALAALRAADHPTLTDFERASLHRKVAAQLPPVKKQSRQRPAQPWFQRLMPAMAAAAALLVVVGVGSVLVNGAGDSDMALDLTTTTTAEAPRAQVGEPAEEAGGADLGAAELDDSAAEETTTTMAAGAPLAAPIRELGAIAATELEEVVSRLSSETESLTANYHSPSDLRMLTVDPPLVCAEIALEDGSITAIARVTVDGDDAEIYQIDGRVDVYDAADCSLTATFD